jgi:hypothetical protein
VFRHRGGRHGQSKATHWKEELETRKQTATSARKKGAKRAAPKKVSSKVRKTARGGGKVPAKKRTGPKSAAKTPRKPPRQTAELSVEDTIIDVVNEPAPGMVRVREYEVVRTIAPERDTDADMD